MAIVFRAFRLTLLGGFSAKHYWILVGTTSQDECEFETVDVHQKGYAGLFEIETLQEKVVDIRHTCPDGTVIKGKRATVTYRVSLLTKLLGVLSDTHTFVLEIFPCDCSDGTRTSGRIPARHHEDLSPAFLDRFYAREEFQPTIPGDLVDKPRAR
jgi:hypothetical protein